MNDSVGINHEQGAFANAVFFVVNAISARHRSFRFEIGQKRKAQLILPGKSRVTPCAVDGDTNDFSLELLELIQNLIVKRHLIAANGAPVGRVKRQYHRSSAELMQRHRLVRRGSQCKKRSLRTRANGRPVTICLSLEPRSSRTHYIYRYGPVAPLVGVAQAAGLRSFD